VKPNLTVDNVLVLLCKNEGRITVSDDQLPVGGKWKNVEFSFRPIPIKQFPFPFPETSLAIPIPMEIQWDPQDPWEFPYRLMSTLYPTAACYFPERDYVTFGYILSQICMSVVCNVRASYSTS